MRYLLEQPATSFFVEHGAFEYICKRCPASRLKNIVARLCDSAVPSLVGTCTGRSFVTTSFLTSGVQRILVYVPLWKPQCEETHGDFQ